MTHQPWWQKLVTLVVVYLMALGFLLTFAKDRTDGDEIWKALPILGPEVIRWIREYLGSAGHSP